VKKEIQMKVTVNSDLCEANAVCVRSCPEVFRLDENDSLTILVDEISETLRTAVERAVRGCPRQALSLEG
jgi:ferredoxin